MVVCKWAARCHIHLWLAIYWFKKPRGKILAVRHWFVKRLVIHFNKNIMTFIYKNLIFISNAGWFRTLIADYGVPLMVLAWAALSFGVPGKLPSGVPRRLESPLPWDTASLKHWTVIKVTLCRCLLWNPFESPVQEAIFFLLFWNANVCVTFTLV